MKDATEWRKAKYRIIVGDLSIIVNAEQFRRLSAMMDSRQMTADGEISILNITESEAERFCGCPVMQTQKELEK
jgi:hypothetical protein